MKKAIAISTLYAALALFTAATLLGIGGATPPSHGCTWIDHDAHVLEAAADGGAAQHCSNSTSDGSTTEGACQTTAQGPSSSITWQVNIQCGVEDSLGGCTLWGTLNCAGRKYTVDSHSNPIYCPKNADGSEGQASGNQTSLICTSAPYPYLEESHGCVCSGSTLSCY